MSEQRPAWANDMHFARLKNHDYRGEGYYFITFATAPRRALLSEIRAGQIRLFPEGRAVVEAWQRIPADDPAYSLRVPAPVGAVALQAARPRCRRTAGVRPDACAQRLPRHRGVRAAPGKLPSQQLLGPSHRALKKGLE